jgi:hypothetical protein
VETVEKSQNDFPTVPTALGKLSAKSAASFPQFPQLGGWFIHKNQKQKTTPSASNSLSEGGESLDLRFLQIIQEASSLKARNF